MKTAPSISNNPIEIEPGKYLNVNPKLTGKKNRLLLQLL